ncbi:uncharacterized protein B0I36DRAFT_390284 [Microdochium trichocladiopsis]|uniref:Uncharacterized protein n=1 Tax=Microdochium trichocladiopsis TaxID=1682393 RepID=A0A9P9BVF5_9PEZI|nr:uncharacterized protein B0I36DRAFT_390284 [Microdochium trichocladiopsis]KAH7039672.1 hypothetical protein B0I36DRAFT_390284 [Microdochium trichocladiopsis]
MTPVRGLGCRYLTEASRQRRTPETHDSTLQNDHASIVSGGGGGAAATRVESHEAPRLQLCRCSMRFYGDSCRYTHWAGTNARRGGPRTCRDVPFGESQQGDK